MSFLNSIEKKSKKFDNPFTHWELNEPLTDKQVNENLSLLGSKSINLPLGEVKIKRQVKALDIIIRTCASVNMLTQNKSRLFEKERIEYTIRTINSLLKAFSILSLIILCELYPIPRPEFCSIPRSFAPSPKATKSLNSISFSADNFFINSNNLFEL